MIPLRDHNPSHRTPVVTYTIIALCVVVWLYEFSLGAGIQVFFERYALQPAEIAAGASLITLLTSIFLHGGWMHLIGNMMFLHIFGDNLESRLGHVRFLLFYILCGILASAAQILTDPTSMIPNVGASGAIAGVMGAYLLLYPRARVDALMPLGGMSRMITVPAFGMLGYWFVFQLFSGTASLATQAGASGGVAYWAHIGGFVAGLVLILPSKLFGRESLRR